MKAREGPMNRRRDTEARVLTGHKDGIDAFTAGNDLLRGIPGQLCSRLFSRLGRGVAWQN